MEIALVICILFISVLGPSATIAGEEPAGSYANFRTPGGAAYCGYDEARARYACWTPNDGFEVWMSKGRAHKTYDPYLRGFAPSVHTLRFGWGRCFPSSMYVSRKRWMVCVSRRSG